MTGCPFTIFTPMRGLDRARLLEESETALRPFVTDAGTIEFDMPALIVTARKA